jgi:hypothetical protein
MYSRLIGVIALGAVAITMACPARAQMYDGSAYAFPVPDYVGPYLSSSIIGSSMNSGGNSSKKKTSKNRTSRTAKQKSSPTPKTASAADKQRLIFYPSSAVTRQSNENLAKLLAKDNQIQRSYVLKELNKGEISRSFAQAIAPYKLSSRNLGDVSAAYYLISWKIANGVQGDLNRSFVEATRRSTQNTLALSPQVRAMSNKNKQLAAEHLINIGTLMLMAEKEMQRKNDINGLRRMRESVHRNALKQTGVDLKKIKLTSRGLE